MALSLKCSFYRNLLYYLRDGLVRQGVHLHGDLEVIQVVQEHAEVLELLEGDAHLLGKPLAQPLQDSVVVLGVEEGVPEQSTGEMRAGDDVEAPQEDPGEVQLRDGGCALGELPELHVEHLGLQVLHEEAELAELQLLAPRLAEEVNEEAGVDGGVVLLLQPKVVLLHVTVLLPVLGRRTEDGLKHLELLLVDPLVTVLVKHGEGDLEAGGGFDEDGEEEEVLGVGDDAPVAEGPEEAVTVGRHVGGEVPQGRDVPVGQLPPLQSWLGLGLDDTLQEVLQVGEWWRSRRKKTVLEGLTWGVM